jgi:pimeloyl-ACP methyl ester carboxylesterase
MSALTAATHPDRVSALILRGTFASGSDMAVNVKGAMG